MVQTITPCWVIQRWSVSISRYLITHKIIANGTLKLDYNLVWNHTQFAWTFCPSKTKVVQTVGNFGPMSNHYFKHWHNEFGGELCSLKTFNVGHVWEARAFFNAVGFSVFIALSTEEKVKHK